jgi:hypothetical protein
MVETIAAVRDGACDVGAAPAAREVEVRDGGAARRLRDLSIVCSILLAEAAWLALLARGAWSLLT